MDQINLLKGRMAEALVEGIFKRAQYTVARVGRETQVPALMRTGRAEFTPDFVVWRALGGPGPDRHSYRLLAIEVKYRADLEEYLRRDSPSRAPEVSQQGPELYEIIVTDRPDAGRSCFQAVHVSAQPPRKPPVTRDLHPVPDLDIYPRTVEEYEGLVREIFPIFGSRTGGSRTGGSRSGNGDWPRPAGDPQGYRPSPPHEHRQGVSE